VQKKRGKFKQMGPGKKYQRHQSRLAGEVDDALKKKKDSMSSRYKSAKQKGRHRKEKAGERKTTGQ